MEVQREETPALPSLPSHRSSPGEQAELVQLMYSDFCISQFVFWLNFCPMGIINRNQQKTTYLTAT